MGGLRIKSECAERKREGSLCPNAAQPRRVSCSGLRPPLACEREGGRGNGGGLVAVQKVKERGSCPMRDNKNRPHRPLWRSCSLPGLGRAGPSWARPPPPSQMTTSLLSSDHFHKPDAAAVMMVDHKLLARGEKKKKKTVGPGHVEVTVAILSCVTTPTLPAPPL